MLFNPDDHDLSREEVHLETGGVLLFFFPLDGIDASVAGRILSNLPSNEREEIDAVASVRLKNAMIASRAFLRLILARLCGSDPLELRIVRGIHGKPSLESEKLFFNLSHTKNWGLLAVAGSEIGCDIERIRKTAHIGTVCGEIAAPGELSGIFRLKRGCKSLKTLFRFWTAKEAVVKLHGMSIWHAAAYPIKRAGNRLRGDGFFVRFISFRRGYSVAVALYERAGKVKLRKYLLSRGLLADRPFSGL